MDNPRRFLRLPDVQALTGLTKTRIWMLEAAGDFPKRIRISVRTSAWLEAEVLAWMSDTVTRSRQGQAAGARRKRPRPGKLDQLSSDPLPESRP